MVPSMSREPAPAESANPYVGPRAFGEEDRARFFGRAREIRELRALAISRRAVLLYAPSGAGKTSLLQAGLLVALRAVPGAACLPVTRVSGEAPDGLAVSNLYVFNLLSFLIGDRTEPLELASLSLREGLARAIAETREAAAGPDGEPEVLFLTIDQGEEIFSFAPQRVDERQDFFRQLQEALRDVPEVTLILALREDWLADLDPYLGFLPDRMRTRFRLELLGREQALQAIVGPARLAGVDLLPEAAGDLVDGLRRLRLQEVGGAPEDVPGPYVDPVQLQVVCRQLWERRPPDAAEIGPAEVEALGSVERALADYYAAAVAEAAALAGNLEKAVRRWIGRQLVTRRRLRGQVLRESAVAQGLDNKVIDRLVSAHLVRAVRRRGAVWLELAHDRLIDLVLRDNATWEKDRARRRLRLYKLWAITATLAFLVATGAFLAVWLAGS
jgi:hypothetical protein